MRGTPLARLGRRLPLSTARANVPAGLTLGVQSVPAGLAGGLLAGINPVYGLYGYMVGTLVGAVSTSSVFMAVQGTSAMAVVIADIPGIHGDDADAATGLFTLAVLTGIVMLVLGLARLGGLVRWVPNAVLTGFINAVAVNIVLGQLGDFTGYASDGDNRIVRAIDTIVHLSAWLWPTVLIGATTVALILILERTRLGPLSLVVAIAVSSALVPVLGLDVSQLRDITEVPRTLPSPSWPSLARVGALAVPALSLAFVGLVQGAAISSSLPNPDGTYPDPSGDFRGQGIANIGAGLLQGMPVGGSMSATSIVTKAGARSRLALLIAGATMVIAVVALSGVVGRIAMPALAGLLIVIGFRTLRIDGFLMVWRTGAVQATVLATTFVLTVIIPLHFAVLVGVGMSVLLYVIRQSNRVTLREWEIHDGHVAETAPRASIGVREVVVLRPYGSLFFAAAPLFEQALPAVNAGTRSSAVVISLRGKEDLGSTFIGVITRYAQALAAHGSGLWISGVSERTLRQLEDTGAIAVIGRPRVHRVTPVIAESTRAARAEALAWIATRESPT